MGQVNSMIPHLFADIGVVTIGLAVQSSILDRWALGLEFLDGILSTILDIHGNGPARLRFATRDFSSA